MKRLLLLCILIGVVSLSFYPAISFAEVLVNVNCTNTGGPTAAGAAGTGVAGDYWNEYAASAAPVGKMSNLREAGGTLTNVSFQIEGAIVAVPVYLGPIDLFKGYHFVMGIGTTATITIEGLTPNTLCDLYLYTSVGLPQSFYNQYAQFSFDGGTTWNYPTTGSSATYAEDENYMVLSVMTDAAGSILGTMKPVPGANPYAAGAINAIQIVDPVMDPCGTEEKIWDLNQDADCSVVNNGIWSYGWGTSLGDFTLMDHYIDSTYGNLWESSVYHGHVWYNSKGSGGEFGVPLGSHAMHSPTELGANWTKIRWTAPATLGVSEVMLWGYFGKGDAGMVDVKVVKNGSEVLFEDTDIMGSVPFNLITAIAIGDTLDLLVGPGSDGDSGDNTNVSFIAQEYASNNISVYHNLNVETDCSQVDNGTWSYGWGTSLGDFTLMDHYIDSTYGNLWESSVHHAHVWHNSKGSGGEFGVPLGSHAMHPPTEPGADWTKVRWTASAQIETLAIHGYFGQGDGGLVDLKIVKNGSDILFERFDAENDIAFYLEDSVLQDDTIDFLVGPGSDGSTNDNTNVAFFIQEPTFLSLDGGGWQILTDPTDIGIPGYCWFPGGAGGFAGEVPMLVQETYPGYQGLAWCLKDFVAPRNPDPDGRYLLRFWEVNYKATVFVNGVQIGSHEGAEEAFVLDITDAVHPGQANRLAVRILIPTYGMIDGITLDEIPYALTEGGIIDSVELLVTGPVWVEDLFVIPDYQTGFIDIKANVRNFLAGNVNAHMSFAAQPGPAQDSSYYSLPAGDSLIETQLTVPNHQLWDLDDPCLYDICMNIWGDGFDFYDTQSARCGFREFKFENGYFRLNGQRMFLRGALHSNGNQVGLTTVHDPNLLLEDIIKLKAMGVQCIRFTNGLVTRKQLDLCDEVGMMAYVESTVAWLFGPSEHMQDRYETYIRGMIKKARNHPSVTIWGLLNEENLTLLFKMAVESLPWIRTLDESRMVLLSSGRFDDCEEAGLCEGPPRWRIDWRHVPFASYNNTAQNWAYAGSLWEPWQFAMHPGAAQEYSVVRWTAPSGGSYPVNATFKARSYNQNYTDVHILHNGAALFNSSVTTYNTTANYNQSVSVQQGDVLDFVVGYGDWSFTGDTTALALTVGSDNLANDFSLSENPSGVWTYGYAPYGDLSGVSSSFKFYAVMPYQAIIASGSFSNPYTSTWDESLADRHRYYRIPNTASVVEALRTLSSPKGNILLSEYGFASAIDYPRMVELYALNNASNKRYGPGYQFKLNLFMDDWNDWNMADAFAGDPDNYFYDCLAKAAKLRQLGVNALRSNPNMIGSLLTGSIDEMTTALGLITEFREDKPGMPEAILDSYAPLRFCLFAEPVNIYRGDNVHLEAVLANEDMLSAGAYPVRVKVLGPGDASVLNQVVNVSIADPATEPPLAQLVFSSDITANWPSGKYRFTADFVGGPDADGANAEFYVTDATEMPEVNTSVVLWGSDSGLYNWLSSQGISVSQFTTSIPVTERKVILVSSNPASPGGQTAFDDLTTRIENGSVVIFLSPAVFASGDNATAFVPLNNQGILLELAGGFIFPKDDWNKSHAIFDGLPSSGVMDYTFYREIIPDHVFSGQNLPLEAVAGGISTSSSIYQSGLTIAVHQRGEGYFILNTMLIRDNLGDNPAAERLLRNLLRYAQCREIGPIEGDTNIDCCVDLEDFAVLSGQWLDSVTPPCPGALTGNLNDDCIVNMADMLILAENWLRPF